MTLLDERVTKALRPAVVAPVVAGLLAAAIGGGVLIRRGNAAPELKPTEPATQYVTPSMPADKTEFSLGELDIEDPGGDVQVISVKALTSPNVEYLGAFTTWPRDLAGEAWTGGPGFPGPVQVHRHELSEVVPASEFRPGANVMTVTVGYRITSGDIGALNGLLMTYKVGGKTKHRVERQSIIACVKPNPCEPAPGQDSLEWQAGVLRRSGLLPEKK